MAKRLDEYELIGNVYGKKPKETNGIAEFVSGVVGFVVVLMVVSAIVRALLN